MKVSIIYMASLYLALPSEFDTLVMRTHIYIKVLARVLLLPSLYFCFYCGQCCCCAHAPSPLTYTLFFLHVYYIR